MKYASALLSCYLTAICLHGCENNHNIISFDSGPLQKILVPSGYRIEEVRKLPEIKITIYDLHTNDVQGGYTITVSSRGRLSIKEMENLLRKCTNSNTLFATTIHTVNWKYAIGPDSFAAYAVCHHEAMISVIGGSSREKPQELLMKALTSIMVRKETSIE